MKLMDPSIEDLQTRMLMEPGMARGDFAPLDSVVVFRPEAPDFDFSLIGRGTNL